MRLRETIRYELAYQARRSTTWLYVAVLAGLVFMLTSEAQIADARNGDTPVNTPFVLSVITLFGSVMALLPLGAIAGEAAARDVQTRTTPLFYTAPVGRATYLGGRLLAALVLGALVVVAVPLGILLAVLVTDADPAVLGPVRLAYYAGAWLGVALPNVIIATSLAFALATRTGRMMAGFGAVALLFVCSMLCAFMLGVKLDQWTLAALLDPLAITPLSQASKAWGPEAKRTGVPYATLEFVRNRALWLGVAGAVLALTARRFRFAHHVQGAGRRRAAAPGSEAVAMEVPIAPVRARRVFGPATHARQLAAVARESYRAVVLGWGGLVMLAMSVLVMIVGPELMEQVGVPFVPVTARLADYLGAPLEMFTTVPALLIAYYAGELVWRDRDAGLGEIAGAAPVPDWAFLLGRTGGLALALATFQAFVMTAAVVVQLRMGHHAIEPWLHVRLFLGMMLADWLLFVALAVAVHVVVAHKYVGHLVMLGTYAFTIAAARLGVEHRLLIYAADPGWSYTDLPGFGRSLAPWLTLELYWAAWAALLLVAGTVLWTRGREGSAAERVATARRRLTPRVVGAAVGAAGLVLALGGFTFYNTNVLHDHRTAAERDALRAEYERRYGRYDGIPQPLLDGVRLHVVLHPERGSAEIRGSYRLVHHGAAPVASIHVALDPSVATGPITLDRASTPVASDDEHGYRILALAEPMQPGDTLRLDFAVRVGRRGFANSGVDDGVTPRASFLRSDRLPAIGYQRGRELADRATRLDHGLPPRQGVPSLDDPTARHAVALAGAERIMVEATIATDQGQRAVAPGALRRTWTEGGRRWFHYATERPIRNDFAIFSARYAVRAGRWRDVQLEVVHHPGHGWNADGILAGMRASLEYLTATFGPYPYGQLRFVEHPGQQGTLHAFPVNVAFEEGYALMDPTRDPRGVDFPFGIAAHEVAHEWWGGQLQPAPVEGGALLSESLAWYSALGVVEHARGRAEMERMIDVMREAYLPPRAPADPPLLRASGWFLAYRKGPLAMVALREYLGAERVDGALGRLLDAHRGGRPPFPTTRDLYRELEAAAPDSLRYLVADLFAANTAWELATDTVTAQRAPGGATRLTLDVRARKLVVDTLGVEREVPMNDLVEVGAFADGAAGAAGARGASVYRRLHRIRSGTQRITITVPATATWAGVDPRQLLFDFESGNNVARLKPDG